MDAKLKELQEQKNAKAVAIKELAARQDNWTAEDRTAWDAVNKEYDETAAALKARDEELKSAEAVQARLKQIEDEQRATNGDRKIGLDEERRREANPERIDYRSHEIRANALQSWALCQTGAELRDEHRKACHELGFEPRTAKQIVLSPDGTLQRAVGADSCDLPFGSALRRYGDPACPRGGRQLRHALQPRRS